MADLKISQLTDGGASQATDEYVIARSGANYRIDGASVAAAATSVGTLTSLTVSGDLTVDTSTLKVDSTNNRVGVGTASPGQTLDVSSTSTNVARFATTAAASFSIMQLSGNSSGGSLEFRNGATGLSAVVGTTTGTGDLKFYTNAFNTLAATIDSAGNLGLGVTPSAWGSAFRSLQVGKAVISTNSDTTAYVGSNWVAESGGDRYIAAGGASVYSQSNGAHIWYNAGTGAAGGSISFTERMRLDASGNLLVGTTSSAYSSAGRGVVEVNGSSESLIALKRGDTNNFYLHNTSAAAYLWNTPNTPLVFATNNTERARITSGGYFKASNTGTYRSSTSSAHEFNNDVTNNAALIANSTSASFTNTVFVVFANRNTTNGTFNALAYYNDAAAATKWQVADSGNVTNTNGSYGTISDIKHKQDVIDAPSQWDDLKAIRFRKFRMKSDVEANPDAPYLLGVVAQEVQAVSPGLVEAHVDTERVEVTDEDGNVTTEMQPTGTETLSVKSSILLMKAAVALQEAMARIEALEARLEALEA